MYPGYLTRMCGGRHFAKWSTLAMRDDSIDRVGPLTPNSSLLRSPTRIDAHTHGHIAGKAQSNRSAGHFVCYIRFRECRPDSQSLSSMSRYNNNAPYGYSAGHNNHNPATDGWTHTGSNETSKVDFYEKGNTRMDYYPTTVRANISVYLSITSCPCRVAEEAPSPAGYRQDQHEPPQPGSDPNVSEGFGLRQLWQRL